VPVALHHCLHGSGASTPMVAAEHDTSRNKHNIQELTMYRVNRGLFRRRERGNTANTVSTAPIY
jgi:hypothetical protein